MSRHPHKRLVGLRVVAILILFAIIAGILTTAMLPEAPRPSSATFPPHWRFLAGAPSTGTGKAVRIM